MPFALWPRKDRLPGTTDGISSRGARDSALSAREKEWSGSDWANLLPKTFHQPFINSRLDSPPIRLKARNRSHISQ